MNSPAKTAQGLDSYSFGYTTSPEPGVFPKSTDYKIVPGSQFGLDSVHPSCDNPRLGTHATRTLFLVRRDQEKASIRDVISSMLIKKKEDHDHAPYTKDIHRPSFFRRYRMTTTILLPIIDFPLDRPVDVDKEYEMFHDVPTSEIVRRAAEALTLALNHPELAEVTREMILDINTLEKTNTGTFDQTMENIERGLLNAMNIAWIEQS